MLLPSPKESQSQATANLAKDLTYFFSNDYLSANDFNTTLGRLIPAVVRGETKPRVARTVAYMLQTLFQSTRLAQHEYINAFGADAWRDAISTSVTANHDYLYPPDPNAAPDRDDESDDELNPEDDLEPQQSTQAPIQSPAPPAPTTQPPTPASPPQQPAAAPRPPPQRPSHADTEAALAAARSIFPPRPNNAPPPAPPQQLTPPCDPFELRFSHTSLRADGKPW